MFTRPGNYARPPSLQAFHSSGDLCSAAKAQLSASRHALRARSADVATAAAEKALQIFRESGLPRGWVDGIYWRIQLVMKPLVSLMMKLR
jgi:hypothetical protein